MEKAETEKALEEFHHPRLVLLDHIAADTIGRTTPYSTLELSCNDHKNNIESDRIMHLENHHCQ